MARSEKFEVGITFCSGRVFTNETTDLEEAMKQYAWMLRIAIDPRLLTVPGSRHIARLTVVAYGAEDADGKRPVTQHIYSDHYDCDCVDKAPPQDEVA